MFKNKSPYKFNAKDKMLTYDIFENNLNESSLLLQLRSQDEDV